MSIGKLLVLLIGLTIVAFAVKTELSGTAVGTPNGPTMQKRQLDNVRVRAKELEREQQKSVDDAVEKTSEP